MLKRIASEFGLELHFRVVLEGNKVVGRYVDLKKQIAGFEGKAVTFGKDLVGIVRKEDSSNIVTALLGIGPDRDDGTRLTALVEDQDALQRWGRDGQHLIEPYEVDSTNMDITLEEIRTLTENELQKRIDAFVSYECEAVSLEHVFGHSHEKIRVYQTIRIKDEKYNPPLYLEARIKDAEVDQITNQIKKFTIGGYIVYKKEELEARIKTLQSLMSGKITKLVNTEEQARIDVVSQAIIDAAEDATAKANTAKSEAIDAAALDAKTKADAAQLAAEEHALAKANLAETNAEAHADGIVSTEEQAIIDGDIAKFTEAKADAKEKADAAELAAKNYTDSKLTSYVNTTLYDNDLQAIQAQN